MKENTILHARPPSLRDRRGSAELLVWGELPDWMVVDAELASFLRRFDGKSSLHEILEAHRCSGGDIGEARAAVRELEKRGILSADPGLPPRPPEPNKIANVTLNVTNRCNLRCPWCYNAERSSEEAPAQDIAESLKASSSLLDEHASFIVLGGEPFLDLARLLEILDGVEGTFQTPVLISTNGTLLGSEAVEAMVSRPVEVQVSLDSFDPAKHDAARGRGVHAKALDGAKRLIDAGVYTIISMVYTRENSDAFEPYLELARDIGAREARFIPLRRIGGGAAYGDLAPDQARSLDCLLDVLDRRPELKSLLGRDWFSIAMTVLKYSVRRRNCGLGRKVIFIDADGKVYPCPNHARPDFLCGDIGKTPLTEIWKRSRVLKAIRNRNDVESYPACRNCPFRFWCAGDCRGEVLSVSGKPDGPSPHCGELKQVYKRMLWLLAEGDERLAPAARLRTGKPRADEFVV